MLAIVRPNLSISKGEHAAQLDKHIFFVFSYISIKLKIAQMPTNSNWFNFYGVGILTGIGFTMSLFVGNLAFIENTEYIDGVKLGVLSGSLLSTLAGYFLILSSSRKWII